VLNSLIVHVETAPRMHAEHPLTFVSRAPPNKPFKAEGRMST
jgi:hypothetical protein